MNMKKTVALVLVIALAVVLCVSCAKKEAEAKTEMVSFTVVNNSGKNVTELALSDRKSGNKVSATPQESGWEDGSTVGFSLLAVIEDNAPDLMFSYTVEGGDNVTASITRKEGTITLVTKDDGISFDISEPAK